MFKQLDDDFSRQQATLNNLHLPDEQNESLLFIQQRKIYYYYYCLRE